jgi:hypothetical protein
VPLQVVPEIVPEKNNFWLRVEMDASKNSSFIEQVIPKGCLVRITHDSDFSFAPFTQLLGGKALLNLAPNMKAFICCEPVDMRSSLIAHLP